MLLGITGFLALLAQSCNYRAPLMSVSENSIPVTSELQGSEVLYQYEGESKQIIENVYSKYGIYIASLKEWNGQPNLPWPTDAIRVIKETLSELPPSYLEAKSAPKYIFLVRTPKTFYSNVAGGQAGESIVFYISETFDINKGLEGDWKINYGDAKTNEKGAIAHEFTHAFMKDHPELMIIFERDAGWVIDDKGNYINTKPSELMPEAYADKNPSEDIAVTVARAFVGGQLSNDRLEFLERNEPWSSWLKNKPVKEFFIP